MERAVKVMAFSSRSAAASHLMSVKLTPLYKEFHQQFELRSVICIFQIDRYGHILLFPLESFVDIVC